ncbi:hypothetical protein PHYPSEUDO_002801 [Phytophthora pseudosyringae]|uniref:M96 mating-specific protein family n=1 Tax=Phytophthora pseudosyringae TaxID=221518 RepID=A0A8T1VS85_9STRA|nr:hypothetical protein PHYPSEUDO_002801 [Phytophthora pseudosyringae]
MTDGELDAAAVEAAMAAFLHEFSLSTEATTSKELLCHSTSEWPKLKATDRRDRYRRKLQRERQTLRRQERELSVELSQLQDAQAKAKEEERRLTTLGLSAWRATAARQKDKRLEAEATQQHLKMAVLRQAELLRLMNAMLLQPVPVSKSLTSSEGQVRSREVHGALLFKTLLGELDLLYTRTDEVVQRTVALSPPEAFALRRTWNPDKTVLESADATQLPVAFDQTWRALSGILLSGPHGDQCPGKIEDPMNTAAITYHVDCPLESGGTAVLAIYNAVRRYVEQDRVVVVWRVLSEGQGEFDGLYSDERGWLVIRPGDGHATALECYAQLKPMGLNGQSASSDARGNRFVELLRTVDDEDMTEIKRAMQRLRVDESASDSDVVEELELEL